MTNNSNRSDLLVNLEQVRDWSTQQEVHCETKDVELTRQIQQSEQEIARLNQRLTDLRDQKTSLDEQVLRRQEEEIVRMKQALRTGLEAASQVIFTRNSLLSKQRKIRKDRLDSILKEPKYQEKILEYRQFQQTQAELASLPSSYRTAILQHHQTVRKELEPIFMVAEQPLPKTDKPAKVVGLVASIEPSYTNPEAMALILPVPFSVYTEPSGGDDSLAEVLAYRCCGAVTAALHKIGLREVSFHFADYEGYLSIQVWLNGKTINGDIKQSLFLEFEHLRNYTSELQAVRMAVDIAWVDPALLVPEGAE